MVSKDSGKQDVALEKEFKEWLLKKKKWNEESLEDTIRRLVGFKQRKRNKSKLERSLVKKSG